MSWMTKALMLAQQGFYRGEVPVGAVLIYQNQILAQAHNQVEALTNPLAHAEMLTLLEGQKILGSKYLTECDLYVTLQPCALCMAALRLCRLRRLYFGAYADHFITPTGALEVVGGLQETACQHLLQNFFQNQRASAL